MKEPVLHDKRTEHVRFCGYATQLMAVLLGKPCLLSLGSDVSLAGLQRAEVVARSWVTFSQQELLLLIRDHLLAKGLAATASTLVREAGLVAPPIPATGPATSSCTPPVLAVTASSPSTPSTPASSRVPPTSCSASPGLRRPLFSPRDRQAMATPNERRNRSLRQKSDHGPFTQVIRILPKRSSFVPLTDQPCLHLPSDSSH